MDCQPQPVKAIQKQTELSSEFSMKFFFLKQVELVVLLLHQLSAFRAPLRDWQPTACIVFVVVVDGVGVRSFIMWSRLWSAGHFIARSNTTLWKAWGREYEKFSHPGGKGVCFHDHLDFGYVRSLEPIKFNMLSFPNYHIMGTQNTALVSTVV